MPFAERISTLKMVGALTAAGSEFSFAIRDFLDGFYEQPTAAALEEEPPVLDGIIPDGLRLDAYLGAVAEHLCRANRYLLPKWTGDSCRFLKLPWFGMKTHAGRMLLLMDSPSAFRARNLFVSANALTRV